MGRGPFMLPCRKCKKETPHTPPIDRRDRGHCRVSIGGVICHTFNKLTKDQILEREKAQENAPARPIRTKWVRPSVLPIR